MIHGVSRNTSIVSALLKRASTIGEVGYGMASDIHSRRTTGK